jgi:pimeloyl-ACP methyl ester carboxylesterase
VAGKIQQFLLDRIVLRPSRGFIDCKPQQRVVLSGGRDPLECFVWSQQEDDGPADALILKFPGTAGRAERSTEFPVGFLPTRRSKIWTWNPPGYGGSGGVASLPRIADAAIEFWDEVLRRDADPNTPVLLCGNSLGCVTALRVATQARERHQRCGVILRNPPPLIPVIDHVARRYPMGRLIAAPIAAGLNESMNALVTASRVDRPAVFLHSERDTLVPMALQQQVVEAYAGEKQTVLLEGLEHDEPACERHEARIRQAIDWLWNRIGTLAMANP